MQNIYRFQQPGTGTILIAVWVLLMCCPIIVWAQFKDNVYLIDETSIKNVEIVEVGENKVKFRNISGKDLAFSSKQILIAFNGQGKYLSFPYDPEQLANFLSKEESPTEIDLVVTLSEKVFPGHIHDENDFELTFHNLATNQLNQKLSFHDIAAILYKDGSHKFFTSPSQASSILASLSNVISSSRLGSYGKANEMKENVAAENQVSVMEEVKPEEPAPEAIFPEKEVFSSFTVDPELFRRKALQKTRDLETYLVLLSNRETDVVEANKAVEMAIRLFVDEEKQVQVSGKSGKSWYKIRTYLNRLKLLKYDRVRISWTDVSFVSDLLKGPDGNFYGIITFQQRFESFLDGEVVYSDLTKKNVEVMVRPYQKETNGEKEELWEVLLSDIGVVETKFDQ